jgi:hypothetical protein
MQHRPHIKPLPQNEQAAVLFIALTASSLKSLAFRKHLSNAAPQIVEPQAVKLRNAAAITRAMRHPQPEPAARIATLLNEAQEQPAPAAAESSNDAEFLPRLAGFLQRVALKSAKV